MDNDNRPAPHTDDNTPNSTGREMSELDECPMADLHPLARLQAENAQLRAFVNSVYRRAQNSSQKTDLSAFLLYELGTEAAALLASLGAGNTP